MNSTNRTKLTEIGQQENWALFMPTSDWNWRHDYLSTINVPLWSLIIGGLKPDTRTSTILPEHHTYLLTLNWSNDEERKSVETSETVLRLDSTVTGQPSLRRGYVATSSSCARELAMWLVKFSSIVLSHKPAEICTKTYNEESWMRTSKSTTSGHF